jgi:hypothetical protein
MRGPFEQHTLRKRLRPSECALSSDATLYSPHAYSAPTGPTYSSLRQLHPKQTFKRRPGRNAEFLLLPRAFDKLEHGFQGQPAIWGRKSPE